MPAIMVNSFIAFSLATFVDGVQALVAVTNCGLILTFVMALSSLAIIQWKKKEFAKLFITCLGYLSCAVTTYFSLQSIGAIQNMLVWLFLVAVGASLYFIQKNKLREKAVSSAS